MTSNPVLSPVAVLGNENHTENKENIVYLPPSKFKMRLLKRLVSMESKSDLKTSSVLKRTQSENGLQASIVLPNGDIGTIISLEKPKKQVSRQSSRSDIVESSPLLTSKTFFPAISQDGINFGQSENNSFGLYSPEPEKFRRPLKLPPIILPSIYSTKTYPLGKPDPVYRPPAGPITDDEWDELKDCRYLRPAPKKFRNRVL